MLETGYGLKYFTGDSVEDFILHADETSKKSKLRLLYKDT
jgi:hypothetical protein